MYPAVRVEASSASGPSHAVPLPCCCETYVQCSQGLFLARTVLKPECCVNLILQQMEEEQYPGQYWQGRQQGERNGAEWGGRGGGGGVSQRLMRADPVMDVVVLCQRTVPARRCDGHAVLHSAGII